MRGWVGRWCGARGADARVSLLWTASPRAHARARVRSSCERAMNQHEASGSDDDMSDNEDADALLAKAVLEL